MKERYGDRLQINWKNFPLEQANSKEGPDWFVWDQGDDYPSRGLPAFRALEAARLQGDVEFERLQFALLDGRHERRKDFTDPDDIDELAKESGLNLERLHKDMASPEILQRISEDYQAGKQRGVFGTPTFVFENEKQAFVRLKAPQSIDESVRAFETFLENFRDNEYFDEIKRPKPPRD